MQAKTKNIITDFVDLPSEDEKKKKQKQENQAKERMTDHALAMEFVLTNCNCAAVIGSANRNPCVTCPATGLAILKPWKR